MKPGTLTNTRLWLPVLAIGLIVGLTSWDFQPGTADFQEKSPTDTLPKKKKVTTDKKVKDLDDVIEELNEVDLDMELKNVQVELSKALKEIDGEKIRMEIEKSMKEIDFDKIRREVETSLKEIDLEKMKKELNESIAKIDWDKMKQEIEQAQKIDFSKLEVEMKQMQEELKKIKPQIEKEMANVKVEMEKAKIEIEKAKVEMKEYKEFVDGLDKDGLINKKENYTIKHEDGKLTVNGKLVAADVYNKYRSFLEKHKKFNIEKTDDDFDMDLD
jgi:hypothetical protein